MPTEQQTQTKILRKLKEHGIYAIKIIVASRKGVPDIIACHNGCLIAIECKSPTGRTSKLQDAQLRAIRATGGIAFVARSWEDVAIKLQLK